MSQILLFILNLLLVIHSQTIQTEHTLDQIMFVWDIELINDKVLESLNDNGFDTLYIYLSKSEKRKYNEVIELCHQHDIQVYALNGSYEWLNNEEALKQFFNVVEKINNKEHPNFNGVVLDIEPYVLDLEDKEKAYEDFMSLILEGKTRTEAMGLKFNTVIPFWYEKIKLSSMDENENLAKWVFIHSDEVSIMAYRNEIDGGNGIIDLIDEEILYSIFTDTELVITLETRPSDEGEHISFDRFSKKYVIDVIETLKKRFLLDKSNIIYGIHDLESWLELDD